jgi:hypothetical protein
MVSALAWLDVSREEQRRVREMLQLFAQTDSRDEMGVGQIRDVFSELLFPEDNDPWTAAFRIAAEHASELGEFAPHWLYPGPARIERHLMPYILSSDVTKTARLRDALAMYRLAFGQPRQEDLVDLLNQQNTSAESQPAIDLRPLDE